ncbi:MAG: peptide chain release factor N(5)-glutamine methyltransferase [Actinomycetota bacterium]|nr:peptide chain release factor N(5)-glutamine methyltransferase [Actinomycetota bacterium]
MTSALELLRDATAQLAGAGVASPRVDAELLLAHVLSVERARLVLNHDPDAKSRAEYAELVRRRANREPLQHIVGLAPFRHLLLAVGPGVFVPRPETELLVDAVLPILRDLDRPVVVDLCAGSGALALAIANEVPAARVHAVERSPAALEWLRRNAATSDITVVDADVKDPALLRDLRGAVDVVVSNPPYVPSATQVEPEVHADPDEAVFAGADGLALMPAVIERAGELLRPGGMSAVEHDDTHAHAVLELLRADARWDKITDHADLSGRARFATARRASAPLLAN